MTTTDYLLNGVLVALVILQVRGRRLTVRNMLIPLAVVGYAAVEYLHAIPTTGNSLVVVLLGAAVGASLGTACGLTTRVFRRETGIWVKAGVTAAILWIVGVGSRLVFEIWVTHGGQGSLERFSTAHHINSANAWVDGLILMALVEVVCRTGVIALRYRKISAENPMVSAPRGIMETNGRTI